MTVLLKPTHTLPGGYQAVEDLDEEVVFNDSFGTIDIADSTGIDEDKETGDARAYNFNTHED